MRRVALIALFVLAGCGGPSTKTVHVYAPTQGTIDTTIDPRVLDLYENDVTIDPASIDFGLPVMNTHAKGENWFKVEQFPTISYKGQLAKFNKAIAADINSFRGVAQKAGLAAN